jgi:hypothetical protein
VYQEPTAFEGLDRVDDRSNGADVRERLSHVGANLVPAVVISDLNHIDIKR